jgi:large subunit ribosomal protein L15
MISLDNLKKSKGATQKKKRVGRGNASGHGTYSTKGMKGQKARKGVSNLKRLGMRQQLLKIPKKRGFHSPQPKFRIISVVAVNSAFKSGEIVSPQALLEKKIINNLRRPLKIAGRGVLNKELTLKNVAVVKRLQ